MKHPNIFINVLFFFLCVICSSQFSFAQGTITYVSPNHTAPNTWVNVHLTGQNTHFTTGTPNQLRRGSTLIWPNSVTAYNDSAILTTYLIPSNTPIGWYDVISTPDTLHSGFYIGPCFDGCGVIKGKVYNDLNNNCAQDAGETAIANRIVAIGSYFASTDDSGRYTANVSPGTYTVHLPIPSGYYLQTVCPVAPYTANIVLSNDSSIHNDFGVYETPCAILDLNLHSTTNRQRVCFIRHYSCSIHNWGNIPSTPTILQIALDPLTIPISSSPPWASQSGTTLTYNIGVINPGMSITFSIADSVSCAAPFGLGDHVCATASLNSFDNCAIVLPWVSGPSVTTCNLLTNAEDPNEKVLVNPLVNAPDNYVDSGKVLTYQISFQNTGNDTAYTVVIRDTLASVFDPATFIPAGSSHPCRTEVYGPGIIKWTFDHINLVDSGTNEPESHGFVAFKIRPVSGLAQGTTISNNADIYFDWNAPVTTNEMVITIHPTGIEELSGLEKIKVYPNPFSHSVSFDLGLLKMNGTIEIFDMLGQKMLSQAYQGGKISEVDLQHVHSGMYFYRITNSEGAIIAKGKISKIY